LIRFKDFLSEDVNNYYLYHGTNFSGLQKILRIGKILPNTDHWGFISNGKKISGTSFTRNLGVAKHMGDVIIAIPRWSLQQTNKIIPLNFFNTQQAADFPTDPIYLFGSGKSRTPPTSPGKYKFRRDIKDIGEFNEYEEFVLGEISLKRKNHLNPSSPLIRLIFDDLYRYSLEHIKSGRYGNFDISFF